MEYYCPYCNRLEEIESPQGPAGTPCSQCGKPLTALQKEVEPLPRTTSRLGLLVLIAVTGLLLALAWSWGGGTEEQGNTYGAVGDLFDFFVSSVAFFVKMGISLVIVGCAVLIGTKLAAPKRRRSENPSGDPDAGEARQPGETPTEKEGVRTGLRALSIVGMSFGTSMIVVTIVAAICLILLVVGLVLKFIEDVALP